MLTPSHAGRFLSSDAIRVRALAKSYRNVAVLTDITVDVKAGEIMGVVGGNGAGKTTLVEILATVQLPTGGTASIAGRDLVSESDAVKRVIGYCPANAESFYPRLTGGANLEFFAALGGMSPRQTAERSREILDLLRAPELKELIFQKFSSGMKQKLALARALMANPQVLLLDEPTRSLDTASRELVHGLLRAMIARMQVAAALLVTHDVEEARRVCDRVALVEGGKIAAVWPSDQMPTDLSIDAITRPGARRA